VALHACVAARRDAARLLLTAGRAAIDQQLLPPPGPQQQTHRKARACGGRMLGQASDDNDNDFIGMAANRLD